VSRTLVWPGAALVTFTVLEAVLPGVHHVPGAFAAFGVGGCLALVLVANALGAAGLSRPEPPDE
jgi:hypothetical protein